MKFSNKARYKHGVFKKWLVQAGKKKQLKKSKLYYNEYNKAPREYRTANKMLDAVQSKLNSDKLKQYQA